MQFYSHLNPKYRVSFREAVLQGMAPSQGLFMPEYIPSLPAHLFYGLPRMSIEEIAVEVLHPFLKETFNQQELRMICEQSFTFPIPIKQLKEDLFVMELFHGPSLAFKDVGARFMAHVLGRFVQQQQKEITVVTATSGDTGGAVAQAFHGIEGIQAVIFYPAGKVSKAQEHQMATLGGNIHAVALEGTFDDCQAMVKQLLEDESLKTALRLTTANSINVARLLPQMVYYFHACGQLNCVAKPLTFAVPSGNFGNLTAGVLAQQTGLCVNRFIAATNVNDAVPQYLQGHEFMPKASVSTPANAMDVGNPSNFHRLHALVGKSRKKLQQMVTAASLDDEAIVRSMQRAWYEFEYLSDPHTAVALAGMQQHQNVKQRSRGVVLATAHPSKFELVVQQALGMEIAVHPAIAKSLQQPIQRMPMENDVELAREWLRSLKCAVR